MYAPGLEVNQITLSENDDNRPYVHVKLYGIPSLALLDSGSQSTMINAATYDKIKTSIQPLDYPVTLKTASGEVLEILGQLFVPFTMDNQTKIIRTLVVPRLKVNCLCGMDFWNKFSIFPTVQYTAFAEELTTIKPPAESNLTVEEVRQIDQLKKAFKVAVPGQLSVTHMISHTIEIKEEFKNKPAIRQFPYVMSPKVQGLVADELERMLKLGIIERTNSDWASNVVPVIKPSGKVRLCLDARKINERTIRDCYPLPHPGRILGQLPQARYLSTIDLSEAFLQIPLEVRSRKYTSFCVQGKGLFRFTRLPFGLINSPATLSRLMDRVLGFGELEPNVFVYLDDLVIVSETFEEHVRLLSEVARRLSLANLAINLEKSRFGVTELPFLGYLLSTNGLRPNPEKVRPIVEYERPVTITKLRRFLGMANYYRRFIPDFSGLVAPLSELLKTKSKTIKWSDEAENAFGAVKERLITAPVLRSPDFNREFMIQTDASDVAVAGVLTQTQDGHEYVISYFSHKLSTPQRNYHPAEKEALAALLSIEAFRGYVEGSHFTLVTDSSALTHILTTSWKVGSRCSRWSLNLQQHDMTIIHRRGKDNIVADALSRSVALISNHTDSTWYSSLRQKVIDSPDDYVDFRVTDEHLYKFVCSNDSLYDKRYEWKIIPPPENRLEIMKAHHDEAMHLGFEKSLARIRQRFYWPKMAKELKHHIQSCEVCKEVKAPSIPVTPQMGEMRIAEHPWQIVAADFVGPLPRSKQGNQYILVVSDLFSKWVLLQPLKKIESSRLCSTLRDIWFYRNSTPETIITDNGSSFLSRDFKNLLDKFGIQHWLNSRYHSQANPVERVNRTVNAAIRTYARNDQRSWDTRLTEIETILNTSVHSSSKFTPYYVTHGHEMFIQGSDHRLHRHHTEVSPDEVDQQKNQLFGEIYKQVKNNLLKANDTCRKQYNLRRRCFSKAFQPGQLVYRKNMQLSNAAEGYNAKYGSQYLPCMVKDRIGTSSYHLEDLNGKSLGIWPAVHLKPG